MESDQILAKVNAGESLPDSWLVFPLLRQQLILGLFGWVGGVILGGGLFALMAPIMIPHNYQNGVFSAIVSTVLLAIVLYVFIGSIWAFITDLRRLQHISQHVIIITPNDFVQQEGNKITHVPLEYVKHVTARGTPPVDRSLETARQDAQISSVGASMAGFFVGRGVAESGQRAAGSVRKRMRTPTTLAFVDERTDKEIIVVTDKAYGDPFSIAAYLKEYARAKVKNNVM